MLNSILRVAIHTPLRRLFDYLPPQHIDITKLMPGMRILVPFQSQTRVAILIERVATSAVPAHKLKTALALLDTQTIFAPEVFKLCCWAADYYHHALGDVLMSALPVLLRKNRPARAARKNKTQRSDDRANHVGDDLAQISIHPHVEENLLILNHAQQQAVQTITAAKNTFQIFLLDGVTGSGKTEVYLRTITDILSENKQVLVLVPEISLTPQTVARFQTRFRVPIVALHSNLTASERLNAWLGAQAGEIKIIIGTRSAIFTPFERLGLIIVDEEHDTSFKQQDRFRYQARDLAIMRASMHRIPIVLGTATPSLESLLNAQRKRYIHLSLPMRAGGAQLPQYQLINLQQYPKEDGLSSPLLSTMRTHLAANNQVMLFLNRRGFAPVLYCSQCAYIADCKRCDVHLVYHQTPLSLRCHHCNATRPIPVHCPQCKTSSLLPIGLGTQRLEQKLVQHFPDVPIIRLDRDNTKRKGALKVLLERIHTENKAILLGTQILAKGHHFPHVTLVGVVDADNGLFSVDFRAAEQMGQLLLQVAGRAGRAEKPGTVMIQTHYPSHPLLQTLLYQGYLPFCQALLQDRERIGLPPYTHLAVFRAEAYQLQLSKAFLDTVKTMCTGHDQFIEPLGPVSPLIAKRKGLYCQQLWIKASKRSMLQRFLQDCLPQIEKIALAKSVRWGIDVDPVGM